MSRGEALYHSYKDSHLKLISWKASSEKPNGYLHFHDVKWCEKVTLNPHQTKVAIRTVKNQGNGTNRVKTQSPLSFYFYFWRKKIMLY